MKYTIHYPEITRTVEAYNVEVSPQGGLIFTNADGLTTAMLPPDWTSVESDGETKGEAKPETLEWAISVLTKVGFSQSVNVLQREYQKILSS